MGRGGLGKILCIDFIFFSVFFLNYKFIEDIIINLLRINFKLELLFYFLVSFYIKFYLM